MHNGPSPHLSWKELECKDGTPYPGKWKTNRAFEIANVFESIRKLFGNKPITVLSAYRTPKWNRKIGGASKSQHLEGRALDLRPPIGISVWDFYSQIKKNASNFGIKGIGLYQTFVHVDTRPTSKLVSWSGKGIKDDTGN